jgi:ribonuclease P protein component
MLGKKYRLKKKRDFEIVYENGRFVGGRFVRVNAWRIDESAFPKRGYTEKDLKFGFVVSKKVHPGAVKRNRIKRQMREAVRLLLKDDRARPGYLVIISAKPSIFGQNYANIETDIMQALEKARVV